MEWWNQGKTFAHLGCDIFMTCFAIIPLTLLPWFQPFAGSSSTYESSIQDSKVKQRREITVESLKLEPLCSEVVRFSFPLLFRFYEMVVKLDDA